MQAAAEEAARAAETQRQLAAEEAAEALASRRAAAAASLPQEPPAGEGVTQLVVRSPDGKRLQRRFHGGETSLEQVFDWVWAEAEDVPPDFRCAEGLDGFNFFLTTPRRRLVAARPRIVYERCGTTLATIGLTGQVALMLEPPPAGES